MAGGGRAGHFPADLGGKASYLSGLLFDPWVLTALLGALVAALSWMAALTYLNLSRAYPFMGLSFGLVAIFSAIFFAEPLGALKVAGVLLIIFGIAVVASHSSGPHCTVAAFNAPCHPSTRPAPARCDAGGVSCRDRLGRRFDRETPAGA